MAIGQQMMWLGGFNDLFSPLEVNDYLIKQFLVQDRIIASSPEDCSVYLSIKLIFVIRTDPTALGMEILLGSAQTLQTT